MHDLSAQQITLLLEDCINGKKGAVDELLPQVYNELRKISSKYLRDEYRNNTLQTTELVHEAYICLLYTSPSPRDRTRSRMPSSA